MEFSPAATQLNFPQSPVLPDFDGQGLRAAKVTKAGKVFLNIVIDGEKNLEKPFLAARHTVGLLSKLYPDFSIPAATDVATTFTMSKAVVQDSEGNLQKSQKRMAVARGEVVNWEKYKSLKYDVFDIDQTTNISQLTWRKPQRSIILEVLPSKLAKDIDKAVFNICFDIAIPKKALRSQLGGLMKSMDKMILEKVVSLGKKVAEYVIDFDPDEVAVAAEEVVPVVDPTIVVEEAQIVPATRSLADEVMFLHGRLLAGEISKEEFEAQKANLLI